MPGRDAAAEPYATALAKASDDDLPATSARMNPATDESPAPTVLATVIRGADAYQAPSALISTAPEPPSVTSTLAIPRACSAVAASTISSSSPALAARSKAAASPPVSCASSSELGLMRSNEPTGNAASTASRLASEVSTAILAPVACSPSTSRAYQSTGAPGGNDPDSATQEAPSAASISSNDASAT